MLLLRVVTNSVADALLLLCARARTDSRLVVIHSFLAAIGQKALGAAVVSAILAAGIIGGSAAAGGPNVPGTVLDFVAAHQNEHPNNGQGDEHRSATATVTNGNPT